MRAQQFALVFDVASPRSVVTSIFVSKTPPPKRLASKKRKCHRLICGTAEKGKSQLHKKSRETSSIPKRDVCKLEKAPQN